MEKIKIGGILCIEHLTMLRVQGLAGKIDGCAVIFSELGAQKINVQFIVQLIDPSNRPHLTFAVAQGDANLAFDLLINLQPYIQASSILLKREIASIGIYGPDFRLRPGIAGSYLRALHENNIAIYAVSTSISTCSALIPQKEASKAQAALEASFQLP